MAKRKAAWSPSRTEFRAQVYDGKAASKERPFCLAGCGSVPSVILGLDPRIYKLLNVLGNVDSRVKPEDDGGCGEGGASTIASRL